jgi:hypothetical protein
VQGERLRAQQALASASTTALTADDVRELVASVGDISAVLAAADPKLKAELYGDLGLRLTYRPADQLVRVEALPAWAKGCVGGATQTPSTRDPWQAWLVAA